MYNSAHLVRVRIARDGRWPIQPRTMHFVRKMKRENGLRIIPAEFGTLGTGHALVFSVDATRQNGEAITPTLATFNWPTLQKREPRGKRPETVSIPQAMASHQQTHQQPPSPPSRHRKRCRLPPLRR